MMLIQKQSKHDGCSGRTNNPYLGSGKEMPTTWNKNKCMFVSLSEFPDSDQWEQWQKYSLPEEQINLLSRKFSEQLLGMHPFSL